MSSGCSHDAMVLHSSSTSKAGEVSGPEKSTSTSRGGSLPNSVSSRASSLSSFQRARRSLSKFGDKIRRRFSRNSSSARSQSASSKPEQAQSQASTSDLNWKQSMSGPTRSRWRRRLSERLKHKRRHSTATAVADGFTNTSPQPARSLGRSMSLDALRPPVVLFETVSEGVNLEPRAEFEPEKPSDSVKPTYLQVLKGESPTPTLSRRQLALLEAKRQWDGQKRGSKPRLFGTQTRMSARTTAFEKRRLAKNRKASLSGHTSRLQSTTESLKQRQVSKQQITKPVLARKTSLRDMKKHELEEKALKRISRRWHKRASITKLAQRKQSKRSSTPESYAAAVRGWTTASPKSNGSRSDQARNTALSVQQNTEAEDTTTKVGVPLDSIVSSSVSTKVSRVKPKPPPRLHEASPDRKNEETKSTRLEERHARPETEVLKQEKPKARREAEATSKLGPVPVSELVNAEAGDVSTTSSGSSRLKSEAEQSQAETAAARGAPRASSIESEAHSHRKRPAKQSDVVERLHAEGQRRAAWRQQEYLKKLRWRQIEEMKECTFSPHLAPLPPTVQLPLTRFDSTIERRKKREQWSQLRPSIKWRDCNRSFDDASVAYARPRPRKERRDHGRPLSELGEETTTVWRRWPTEDREEEQR